MSTIDALVHKVAAQPDLDHALRILLAGVADSVKATSNDQNIQRLAGDIRASAPALIAAVRGKQPAGLAA